MENTTKLKSLDIKYGELDMYYPLKFESPFSFEEKLELIAERFGKFIGESLDRGVCEKDLILFKEEVDAFKRRAELIDEQYKESIELYGIIYTNAHERFLILPLKIELANGQCVWLHAILYIFENDMCILKLELPLKNVNNIPLKKCEWDTYINKATCVWNTQIAELSTLDEIKKMYISMIQEICGIKVLEYRECLHHIILVDFEGCPYNVNEISDDVQEELFRTIAAPINEAPYTSYKDEAREYLNNSSWGTHNIRCIIKSTGGCLSILDRTVQDYWINKYAKEKGVDLEHDEYLDMYVQYVNKIQNSTEFPFIILLLKRINILNDIRKKKDNKENKKSKYEYWENDIFINTIQEESCGTVNRQVAEFEKMMPYYIKKEITDARRESLSEIQREKETEKEERYQKFIAEGGLMLSLIFGLPAIKDAVSIIRNVCVWIEQDIPYITQDNISLGIWLLLNIIIGVWIKKFRE